jgi:hypothetical protein
VSVLASTQITHTVPVKMAYPQAPRKGCFKCGNRKSSLFENEVPSDTQPLQWGTSPRIVPPINDFAIIAVNPDMSPRLVPLRELLPRNRCALASDDSTIGRVHLTLCSVTLAAVWAISRPNVPV